MHEVRVGWRGTDGWGEGAEQNTDVAGLKPKGFPLKQGSRKPVSHERIKRLASTWVLWK